MKVIALKDLSYLGTSITRGKIFDHHDPKESIKLGLVKADNKILGKDIIALKRAIEISFKKNDLIELGYFIGHEEIINGHPRLLRSLEHGDDDYGNNLMEVIKEISKYISQSEFEELKQYVDQHNKNKNINNSSLSFKQKFDVGQNNDSSNHNEEQTKSVFIVHGHDNEAKLEVSNFLRQLKLEPIILHEQINKGQTIIEKIESHTNVNFAIVLYTPCDFGGSNKNGDKLLRARQNVVFEHGFLIGKIGRRNVTALVKGEVETPSDISGLVYIDMKDQWKIKVAREIRESGYLIDMNNIS